MSSECLGNAVLFGKLNNSVENPIFDDCMQSTESEPSFTRQDKPHAVRKLNKRAIKMLFSFNNLYYEMNYRNENLDRVKDLLRKINALPHEGALTTIDQNHEVIICFNGDANRVLAYYMFEMIRKLATYAVHESVLTTTILDSVEHVVFGPYCQSIKTDNSQARITMTRALALNVNQAE